MDRTTEMQVTKVDAAAEARRRRKMVVKKDKGLLMRKRRTTFYRGFRFVPPPLPPYVTDQERMVFLFPKKLQKSDVNNVGRIILPKQPAETHLPRLSDDESMLLPVIDMDGVDVWSLKFRYWANNQSRMYVFEGTGAFTKKHKLEIGDYMLMYMDMVTGNYMIRAVKACEVEGCANKEETAINENKADLTSQNWSVPSSLELETPNIPEDFVDFSSEDPLAMISMNDDSYFGDVLNSISLWDEFMTDCHPATQPSVSFGNLSSEDLSQV
ncbi:B3 domain-containing transcription factor FUS3-like protein [Tanacetum coccineum]